MAIFDSILDTIGRTPVVKLQRLAPAHAELYVKVEAFNPAGSVKDRLALAIVLDAEARGLLKPGDTIVEATSGNTGVALAAVAAARGYKFVATMVETFSIERRKLIRAYGGKVILTPAAERGTGMVRRAEELAKQHGWFLASQFANPANPAYHRNTTAAEILRDFAGKRLDYFVSGWGTGGTLTGVGEVLKLARPDTRIIATEPAGAALLKGDEWKPHKIQGWTPDFVPEVLNRGVYDELLTIDDARAIETSRRPKERAAPNTPRCGSGTSLAASSFRQRRRADHSAAPTSARAKSSGSKGARSSICSPTPMAWIGRPNLSAKATSTPPLAVPSSFVITRPETSAILRKISTCARAFCPVLASSTNRVLCGAVGSFLRMTRTILESSSIRS